MGLRQKCTRSLAHVRSLLQNWRSSSLKSMVQTYACQDLLELFKFHMRAQIYLERTMEVSDLCDVWYRLLVEVDGNETNNSSVSEALLDIGTMFRASGLHDAALGWYKRALQMELKINGSEGNHPSIWKCLNELGVVAQLSGSELIPSVIEHDEKGIRSKCRSPRCSIKFPRSWECCTRSRRLRQCTELVSSIIGDEEEDIW